jgi:NAD(P)-dependent dehydrogenase (short-subunit alcohol dehydrogenase family)
MKVVLVTGGTGGIGQAIVKKLSSEGYSVCLHYNSSDAEAAQIKGDNDNIYLFKEDFSSSDITLIERIVEKFGRIDCLVNCAGILPKESFWELTSDGFDTLFHINTKIPYLLASKSFPYMKKAGFGRIVNISSIVAKYGMGRNHTVQYAGTKAALEALTTGLSRLGAEHNILVNTIRPGVINTRMQSNRSDLLERINMIPVKRIGSPEEIADMVAFLFSDSGNFITGQTITIAGGE